MTNTELSLSTVILSPSGVTQYSCLIGSPDLCLHVSVVNESVNTLTGASTKSRQTVYVRQLIH